MLTTWRDGTTKKAITAFVEQTAGVPAHDRVATFDNDGTLWCEKPVPIQLDFNPPPPCRHDQGGA